MNTYKHVHIQYKHIHTWVLLCFCLFFPQKSNSRSLYGDGLFTVFVPLEKFNNDSSVSASYLYIFPKKTAKVFNSSIQVFNFSFCRDHIFFFSIHRKLIDTSDRIWGRNVSIGECDARCTLTVSLCIFSMRNGNFLVVLIRWFFTTLLAVSCWCWVTSNLPMW